MQKTIINYSIPAARYAVEICEDKPRFHFGIIVAESTSIESVFDVCLDFVDWLQYDPIHTVARMDSAVIYFKNGSHIEIVRPSDTRRGLRWHACLVDEQLDNKAAHKTIAKYLTWEYK